MFDLGWPELLVIAIVLIVVVGPKDLPRVLRGFGRTTSKLRSMAGDFRKQFDEALREAELDDVKGLVDDAHKLDPRGEIRKHLSSFEEAGRSVRKGLDEAMKPGGAAKQPDKPAEVAPSTPAPPAAATPKKEKKPAPKKAAGPSTAKKPAARAAAKPASRSGGSNKKKKAGTAS